MMGRIAAVGSIGILWVSLLLPSLAQSSGCVVPLVAGDPKSDHFIAVRGADGVFYYTFTDTNNSGSFSLQLGSSSTNPFANPPLNTPVDTSSGSPFPGQIGVNNPWRPIPPTVSAASDPSCTTVFTSKSENEIEIFVRGNDGNIYWTVFDPSTGGVLTPYSGVHEGFNSAPFNGDPDADGWPNTSSQSPWDRVD